MCTFRACEVENGDLPRALFECFFNVLNNLPDEWIAGKIICTLISPSSPRRFVQRNGIVKDNATVWAEDLLLSRWSGAVYLEDYVLLNVSAGVAFSSEPVTHLVPKRATYGDRRYTP